MEDSNGLFEIFAGTYEEFMLGFKLVKNEEGLRLEQSVADHTHKGSIRAISCRGNLLATGGYDEIIHIYSLDENREIGTLSEHTGTVTCLAFSQDEKHLMSCSEDGSIAIYRVGSWVMEKLWPKAHKATYVNWVAIHPSNKMAFSVGNDGNLRTWNLIDGTPAFVTNISHLTKRPELVIWSESGDLYALPHDNEITVFAVQDAKIRHSLRAQNKITCAHFLQDAHLCVGDMCGNVSVYDLGSGDEVSSHQETEVRIKAISSHEEHVVAATSQGTLLVYKLDKEGLELLTKFESSCRITCLALSCRCHRRVKKMKSKRLKTEIPVKKETLETIQKKMPPKKSADFEKGKTTKKVAKIRKVECFPKRQSWVVEEQD